LIQKNVFGALCYANKGAHMTEITRSIEIDAPVEEVWRCIHPENWKKIFYFVKDVNGYTDGKAGVGTQATFVAGHDDITSIRYNVQVTEFVEGEKIAYKRYGGPLVGEGQIQLKALKEATVLRRKSVYEDDLSLEIVQALSQGMERDNQRIKHIVEGVEQPL